MYRRPTSLEALTDIRVEMAREADYDADLFAENVRSGYIREPVQTEPVDAKPFKAPKKPKASKRPLNEPELSVEGRK
jgi:hypothetical protein